MKSWLSLNEIQKLYEERQKYRVKCKCGHTVMFYQKMDVKNVIIVII